MSKWQQKQLSKLIEFGEIVVRLEGTEFILVHGDENVCHMLGIEKEELTTENGTALEQWIYEPDWESIDGQILRDLEQKGEYTAKFRLRRPTGELFWVLALGEWDKEDEDSRCVRNLVIHVDEMENREREQRAVYELIPGGILQLLITKTDFYIQRASKQFYESMGLSEKEKNQEVLELSFVREREELCHYLIDCAETGEPVDFCFLASIGHQEKYFRLIGRFYDVHREGCVYQCVILDAPDAKGQNIKKISEGNGQELPSRQERDINWSLQPGTREDSQRFREERYGFFAMIAREFKDPLSYMERELRQRKPDVGEWGNFCSAVDYMRKVVENITDFVKLEKGKVRIENRQFELDHVLWNIFRTWESRLKDSSVEIALNLNLRRNYYRGDLGHITQALNHIIGNSVMAAAEHSEIHIWGDDTRQEKDFSWLVVSVEGTGIPVAESYFGRDYPLEGENVSSIWKWGGEGTTFSLLVARELAELLGGRIRLYRKGSQTNVIELTIPLQWQTNVSEMRAVDINEAVSDREEGWQGYRFLVLEERQQSRHPVADVLRAEGAEVCIAEGGQAAMEKWVGSPPDNFQAILIDGVLSDMDYPEFARDFRGQANGSGAGTIPLIVVADRVSQDVIEESMEAGINVFLERTLDMKRLKLILDMMQGPFWQK